MASIDVDAFTKPFQLTKSMYRGVYASLEPSNPALNASGKVVLITGAGGKLGSVSEPYNILIFVPFHLQYPFKRLTTTLSRTLRLHGAQRARLQSFSSAAGCMT